MQGNLELQTTDEEEEELDFERWRTVIRPLPATIKPSRPFRSELRRRLLEVRLRLVEVEPDDSPLAA